MDYVICRFAIDVDAAKAALPTNTPESLISLALQCTEYDPSLRPQANVVVDWLSDLEKTIPSDEEMKHLPSIINTVREASLFNNADIPDSTQNIVQHSPLLAFRQFSFDLADSDNENDGSGAAIHLLDENDRYRSFKLYENDANSMATLSTEIATNDKERVVILKSGYLYKRNETGFRNWKKLWCTLTDTRFTWKSSVETPKKNFFDLKECTLKRTRNNRFLLIEHLHSDEERSELDRRPSVGNTIGISFGSGMSGRSMSPNFPANNSTIPAHSPILRNTSGGVQNISFYQREFAAENALEMEEWVYAIQEAINDLIEERQSEDILFYPTNRQNFSDDTKSLSLADTIKPITEVKSIKEWFSAVGFNEEQASKYNDKFIERGYDNIQMIGEVGLQKEDMSFIGIDNPLHSRIILNSFNASYTDTLKLSVVGWSKFDSMVVYKVVSRWKFNRSSLYMRFPNFRRFDRYYNYFFSSLPDNLNLSFLLKKEC